MTVQMVSGRLETTITVRMYTVDGEATSKSFTKTMYRIATNQFWLSPTE